MAALAEIRGLRKTYGDVTAVNDVSFAIAQGRCTVLLGPNGAGKSTILNILAGLLRPTAGAIAFSGLPPEADRRPLIGYLPQQVALFGWMTGLEYVRMAGELTGLGRAAARERAAELLSILGLDKAKDRRIGGYSGGMKQRLGLCQALVNRPPLLILDEPVSGLDPGGRRDVLDLLRGLKDESTILFSTHILPDAEELSDDVLIIRAGAIVVDDSLATLRARHEQPLVEVELGDEATAAAWLERLSAIGGFAERRGSVVRCRFDSAEAMRDGAAAAYRLAAAEPGPVRRVHLGHTTLEDLFLRAVES
ncbi:MAG: ABC transporter ATP-binding protein [Bauldia sp.]|nr:ABC transporter ATP-binding protein [Bauldia sp.]